MSKETNEGITVKKSEDFSEWYSQVVQKAELADIRYGVQGFIVHSPWGFRILRKIYEMLEHEVELDNHEPFLFPLVIKKENLDKEEEHAGFAPEVFWITKSGSKKMEEEVALRPTGETQIYPMYSLWIRSYNDLPYKGYQSRICTYRSEKTTRPFLRGREFMFFETHDVFSTHKEALTQVEKDIRISEDVIRKQCKIPFLLFKRPSWDKFKGASNTFTPDTLMPDGKRNQLASTHDLGQNFAKAFDINFQDKDGKKKQPFQTCYGPGIWRIMAALIGIHGDDNGLILPFDLAPKQVVVVPIFKDKDKKSVLNYCNELKESLNFSCIVDDSEATPGFKYNNWEMKGVPIRIEVGPKEVSSKTVTVVLRTNRNKIQTKLKDVNSEIKKQADILDKEIENKSKTYFKDNTHDAKDLDELKRIMKSYRGFVRVPFCSVDKDGEACADKLKEQTDGVNVCGTLYPKEEKASGNCIVCNKKAKHIVYTAKSY
jgi:prolyl-tRNA synthetase